MKTYTVALGDTLGKIAAKFYGDWRRFGLIMKANRLHDPDHIRVGQTLQIPDPAGEGAENDTGPAVAPPKINADKFKLLPGKYFHDYPHKDLILLHFTSGTSAQSAFSTFKNQKGHVCVPYVLERTGEIFQLFEPRFWSYHLGIRQGDPEHRHDRRSIPIEVVNVGPLKEDPKNSEVLNWWPPEERYQTKYCAKAEKDKYVQAADRGINYYATFTAAQYSALAGLVKDLCVRFGVPAVAPENKLKADLKAMAEFKGIAAHQNFRTDKYDLGPAFAWDKLMAGMR
jgi:N-acetyl-anhydromuramyl-L-alanine amidase AmpD